MAVVNSTTPSLNAKGAAWEALGASNAKGAAKSSAAANEPISEQEARDYATDRVASLLQEYTPEDIGPENYKSLCGIYNDLVSGVSMASILAKIGELKQKIAEEINSVIEGMSPNDDEKKKAKDQERISKLNGFYDQLTQIQEKINQSISTTARLKL